MNDFDDFLNAPEVVVQPHALRQDGQKALLAQVKATRERQKFPQEEKKRRDRSTSALTFTCTVEMLGVLDALALEKEWSRAMCARNVLITYLNLTMLERQGVWDAIVAAGDVDKVTKGMACVSLVLKDVAVRERLDKVTFKDRVSVAEVFRRAIWNVTK
jgi:hypothetical protein